MTDAPVMTKRPRITSVLTLLNERWMIGKQEPNTKDDDPNATVVVDMFLNDDGSVEVFTLPKEGSGMVQAQGDVGIVFRLPPNSIIRTVTMSQREIWEAMRRDMTDQHVAQIMSQWTDIPADMLFEMIQEAREDLADTDPEEPEPETTSPPNGTSAAPTV